MYFPPYFVGYFVLLFNLEFCYVIPLCSVGFYNHDVYDVTEVLRIKECSPIPPSYLLNSIHLISSLLLFCQLPVSSQSS